MKTIAEMLIAGAVAGAITVSMGTGRGAKPFAAQGEGVPAPANPYKGMQTREEVYEFTQKPKVTKQGERWIITFASKGKCDATVAILDKDAKIIRHLASGVLGVNAPYPFQQNSLSQKLEWDGKDDQGKPAPAGCKARVGLGLKATYGWTAPLLGKKGKPLSDIGSMTPEEEKAWPKLKTPEGGAVLLPEGVGGIARPGMGPKADPDRRFAQRYQMAIDARREEVYISGGQACFNGQWRRLDGKTGKWDPAFKISAMEIAAHPSNGLLYVRDMRRKQEVKPSYWGHHWLKRVDRDGKPVPLKAKFAGPDGEVLLPADRSPKSFGDGMAFSPNGDLYMLCEQKKSPFKRLRGKIGAGLFVFDSEGNAKPLRQYKPGPTVQQPIQAFDENGKQTQDVGWHVYILRAGFGVVADRHGNAYVGTYLRPVGKFYPDDLAGSPDLSPFDEKRMWVKDKEMNFFLGCVGSVVKFEPSGVKVTPEGEPTHWLFEQNKYHMHKASVKGALWTYVGMSPLTIATCLCPQSRIVADGFGRIFVPQLHRQAVLALGPNGNQIAHIGKYGRADVEMKDEDIRFACPAFMAASDTALYVADKNLGRVVKVKLGYHAEEELPLP